MLPFLDPFEDVQTADGYTFTFNDRQTIRRIFDAADVQKDESVLEPNHFVLASTAESIRVPHDMAAYVEGRSSIGRLGLQVQNAGFIDAGFHGQITLELENQSGFPIVLKKGVRICQIVFVQIS